MKPSSRKRRRNLRYWKKGLTERSMKVSENDQNETLTNMTINRIFSSVFMYSHGYISSLESCASNAMIFSRIKAETTSCFDDRDDDPLGSTVWAHVSHLKMVVEDQRRTLAINDMEISEKGFRGSRFLEMFSNILHLKQKAQEKMSSSRPHPSLNKI